MFKKYSMFCLHDQLINKRSCSNLKKITKIVCDHTGLSELNAESFLTKFKLENKQPYHMIDSFQTYEKLGFSTQEILENGRLFNSYPREHEQHFWFLEEAGFRTLNADIIVRSRSFNKQSIRMLKDQGYIDETTNVAESFLSYIKNPDFRKNYKLEYKDELLLTQVHYLIARPYLAWRLQASEQEIIQLYFAQPSIINKSFRIMEENICIAEELGFPLKKIHKCGYIIRNYPGYPKQTLKEFPTLVGCNMRKAMKNNPTLVATPTIRIKSTYEVLKEFKIPDEHIRKEMGIFQVAPETVRSRLEELRRSPDTAPLLKIPRLIPLLIYHTRTKPKLPFLRLMKAKCINYRILEGRTNCSLERYMREGKDENCKTDVCAYFQSILEVKDREDLITKLNRHPYYFKVPLHDVGETLKYLLKCGFRRNNIYQTLWILLYPMDKIKTTLKQLKEDPSKSFLLMSQVQKLNTILYEMEKEHHFTGHGIFTTENDDFNEPIVI